MIKILKAWLTKNNQSYNTSEYSAEVTINKNFYLSDIIDEMIKEGLEIDRSFATKVITTFNKKTSDLVFSGNKVDTGLVSMYPIIKGQLYNKTWNPNVNSVNVSIIPSNELRQGMFETTVEIVGEKAAPQNEKTTEQSTQSYESFKPIGHNQKNDIPACGLAFRAWLCKA
ncbi:MAG TPA: DNA-binding domain-containing protein [Paludibacter sp.]|jgi:hypothetical protein|nr:DNA-binding domain-containing protein [Paludibacter sp.]